jgi:hypothetical protein
VKVDGTPVKHGAADLADLEDVSKSITLELAKPAFDRETGKMSMIAELKNTSKNAVEGPVKVRVVTLESEIGVPEITNADNRKDGRGVGFQPSIAWRNVAVHEVFRTEDADLPGDGS